MTIALFAPVGTSKTLAGGGRIRYVPAWLLKREADPCLQHLLQFTKWEQGRYSRLTAYHGDAGTDYAYGWVTHHPEPWTPLLLELRARVEAFVGEPFNSALLNYYRDGRDYLSWHADDEPELGADPTIASLSFGAARRFMLRRRDAGAAEEFSLGHGDLLMMSGPMQRSWQHCVPREGRVDAARINVTFRSVVR